MMQSKEPNRRKPWQRPSVIIVSLLAILAFGFIGQGLWIKAKAELSQVLLDRAFERALAKNSTGASASGNGLSKPVSTRPWSWADIEPLARIEAPALNQSSIVLASVSGEALAFGPGHLGGTPLPGERGTSVLAAHRDTHFKWVRHLRPGDTINVTNVDGSRATFQVSRAWIARFDAPGIDPHSTGTRLALTTCYPFDATAPGPMRYVVETELVTPSTVIRQVRQPNFPGVPDQETYHPQYH